MADIALWNGDICDLEVDAIVSPASTSLWMATGVAGAIKRRGGDAIEFAAVRQGPIELGAAVVTPAGSLAARWVIHAASQDQARRTDGPAIDRAVRSAFARAREIGAETLAIPALGTGVGGFPIEEAARDHGRGRPLRAGPLAAGQPRDLRASGCHGVRGVPVGARGGGRGTVGGDRMTFPFPAGDEQRAALVEEVAREIQLRGMTGPAVLFLHASMPDGGLAGSAMTFFDPVLRQLFGGGSAPASALLADEVGIEQLIDRLEELDEESVWDA